MPSCIANSESPRSLNKASLPATMSTLATATIHMAQSFVHTRLPDKWTHQRDTIVKYTSQITMPCTLILRFLRQSLSREEESKLRRNCSSEHFVGKILIKEETFRKWLAFFCLFTLFISINLFVSTPMFSFQCLLLMSLFYSHITFFYYLSLICTDSKKVCLFSLNHLVALKNVQ